MKRLAPLLLVALLPGCFPSLVTLQRAETVAPGEVEFAASMSTALLEVEETDPRTGAAVSRMAVVPDLELGVRQGLGPNLDLGGKLWLADLGGQIDLKWRFLWELNVTGSVAPGIAFGIPVSGLVTPIPFSNGGSFEPVRLLLPVLFGVRLGEHELVLAPKLVAYLYLSPRSLYGASARHLYLMPGGMLGFDVDLGERGHLMPEADLHCDTATGLCVLNLAVGWYY